MLSAYHETDAQAEGSDCPPQKKTFSTRICPERARLAKGRAWLPDVLFFNDDFRAQAALIALEHAGVRVPDDVAVVAWSALGGSPCHWLEFTRIELNVEDCGDLFARHVLAYLSGGAFPRKKVQARPVYRLGDTFPQISG